MNPPSTSIQVSGVELTARDETRRRWTYVPPRPELERGPNGKPVFNIVQAGAIGFMQCTVRLALDEHRRLALLESLRAVEPNAVSLEAAELTVQRIALELETGAGWVVAAESLGSGASPWNAAFALTISGGTLAAVAAAAAGQSERARVRAAITLAAAPASFVSAALSADVQLETTFGSAQASYSESAEEHVPSSAGIALELSADLADLLSTGAAGPVPAPAATTQF